MKRIAESQLRRLLSLLLVLSMCAGQVYAAEATATTVQLMKTEGTANLTNSAGRSLTVRENMRLYNGYHVETEAKSYAWVNLDDDKLTKLDESSEIELRKDGRKLEVLLNEGSLYFNVEKPLEDSESMNIRTSTMVVGIRGTCGWVRVIDRWNTEVSILEGSVRCTVTDPVSGQSKTTTVTGGERAIFTVYDPARAGDKCDIFRDSFAEGDIPGFVLIELVRDTPLCEKIYADSGINLLSVTREEAENRLKSDQADQAKRLEERERLVQEQERHISVDPVWKNDTPASSGSSSGTSTGGGTSSGPSGVIRLTMPVTAREVQDYLDIPAVTGVTLLPGSGNNTFSVDIPMNVPAGKTLTLNTGVPARVEPGDSMTVDGTAGLNDSLTNNGTITVNSANTLRVAGDLTNNAALTVTATGRSITEGTFINNGTLTLTAGAQVLAKTFDLAAPVDGWTVTGPESDGYYRLVQTQPPHTITFGNTGETGITGEDGTLSTLPDPGPDADGNPFDGWYTQPDGGGKKVTEDTIFTEDTTLYPHWETSVTPPTTYTVTFNGVEGEDAIRTTGADGRLTSLPNPLPDKENGDPFDGWYIMSADGEIGERVTTNTIFSANTIVYPQWTVTVTATISGTVTLPATDSSAARPINGATVRLFKEEGTRAARAANRTLVTSAPPTNTNGEYTLEVTSVLPGEYILTADLPGYTAEQSITITEDSTAYENKNFELSNAWDYNDATKTLTITGNGPMANYDTSYDAANQPWYSSRTEIENVVLTDGVTSIGQGAFQYCHGLTNITIPDSVTTIGSRAFYDCAGLTSIELPSGVTNIGAWAFYNCDNLTEITIPGKVTAMGENVFRDCGKLSNVTIQEGVTTIGVYAFNNCFSLKTIVIPDSVTSIEQTAFGGSGLTEIEIPNSVTTIEYSTFSNCSNLTRVKIPDTVTSIGMYAFLNCKKLTDIDIPNSVVSIGESAFESCTALTAIDLSGVTSIEKNAFFYCSKLERITLSDNLESIGYAAFRNCSSWSGNITIPSKVRSFGYYAFAGCSSLTGVTIPGLGLGIGNYAFSGCSGLTRVEIMDGITGIGSNAFSGCSSLTDINIPDSVTQIGTWAFLGCTKLTSIRLPNKITVLDEELFRNCSGLTSVVIPASVTQIKNAAFSGCTGLTTVYYAGTEEQWNTITKDTGNDVLDGATKHYNYTGA